MGTILIALEQYKAELPAKGINIIISTSIKQECLLPFHIVTLACLIQYLDDNDNILDNFDIWA